MRKSPSPRSRRNNKRTPDVAPQQVLPADQERTGAKNLQEQPGRRKKLSEIVSLIQSLVTIAGILLAGIWFIAQSEPSFKANITHTLTHRRIHDDWTWIHAAIEISNVGKCPLALRYGMARLQQILPLDITMYDKIQHGDPLLNKDLFIVNWPILKNEDMAIHNDIYPGETDKIYYEFVIRSFIETVELYTYFSGTKDDPQGWSKMTIYDLHKKGD